ncbi:MAG: sugar transferase [Deltaproteobacteria bacterium]|nr:MAG: sugar transferase [Deltaproteobacteria bacterium]
MAPPLDVARPGRPPGGLPRLSPRVPAARRGAVPADARLPARAALRRGPPPLDRDARGAGGGALLPRALRAARAQQRARAGRPDRRCRGPAGARPDRRLLLRAGPRLPALDLRGVRGPQRRAALPVATRQPVVDGGLPAAAGPGGRHERRRRRGDRHDPRAARAREELPALCARHDVDEVIIASEHSWQDRLLDSLSRLEGPRARVCVVPSPYEILIGRPEHLRLHDIPLIEVIREPAAGGASAAKRLFDVVLALVLLVPALPPMLLVALGIRLTSGGPVLYTQTRVGKDGRPFTMVKFRTMHAAAERVTGAVLAAENDPRVTWLGRYLRALRLDELPQLWNVLVGDMSFVGPRPERPEFVGRYQREIQGYAERLKVRPGLTGYAQVNGEYHTSAPTKLKYDLAYIYNRSLWLDLKILSETVKVMLTRRGI